MRKGEHLRFCEPNKRFFSVYFRMLFTRRGLSGTLMRTSLPTWAVMWSGHTKSGVLQIFWKNTSLPESQDLTLVATSKASISAHPFRCCAQVQRVHGGCGHVWSRRERYFYTVVQCRNLSDNLWKHDWKSETHPNPEIGQAKDCWPWPMSPDWRSQSLSWFILKTSRMFRMFRSCPVPAARVLNALVLYTVENRNILRFYKLTYNFNESIRKHIHKLQKHKSTTYFSMHGLNLLEFRVSFADVCQGWRLASGFRTLGWFKLEWPYLRELWVYAEAWDFHLLGMSNWF